MTVPGEVGSAVVEVLERDDAGVDAAVVAELLADVRLLAVTALVLAAFAVGLAARKERRR